MELSVNGHLTDEEHRSRLLAQIDKGWDGPTSKRTVEEIIAEKRKNIDKECHADK